ncbi:MAG: PEP-CTERM sorting domain-containing protein [Gammaproteobacteria bacterium]|nr:PEP-CTERM sorting domain-containing protein [Gammaproteobacteria bacterium]
MKPLISLSASVLALVFSVSANASLYQYSQGDIGGFSLIGQQSGGPILFSGLQLNSSTQKYEFVAFTPRPLPTQFSIGNKTQKDFSGFDGVTVTLTNSSFQNISSSAFVATQNQNGGYDMYVGNNASIADNGSATLDLNFNSAHKYTTDSNFNVLQDLGNGQALRDLQSVVAYGFGVLSDKGVFVHASVPEPGTLMLFGAGLLAMALLVGVRRRQTI